MSESLAPAVLVQLGKEAALSLSDHHSCWCAWCLEYIRSRRQLQLHHMIGKAGLRDLFGQRRFLDSWLVPVHAEGCHGAIQRFTDSATTAIIGAKNMQASELIGSAREAFFAGDMNRALYLREIALRRYPRQDQADRLKTNVIHQFNCSAGSMLVTKLLLAASTVARQWRERLSDRWMRQYLGDPTTNLPWQFYAEDVFANGGLFEKAASVLHEADVSHPRWRKQSHSTWGALVRRRALLNAVVDRIQRSCGGG